MMKLLAFQIKWRIDFNLKHFQTITSHDNIWAAHQTIFQQLTNCQLYHLKWANLQSTWNMNTVETTFFKLLLSIRSMWTVKLFNKISKQIWS